MSYKSQMVYDHAKIENQSIPRATFYTAPRHKTGIDAGKLYPLFVQECLPSDVWEINAKVFARLATQITPFMDELKLCLHGFFGSSRIAWDNFPKMMGEREDVADDPTTFTIPVVTCPSGGWTEESLADYFGIPTKKDNADANAIPFRLHNFIHRYYFRDQHVDDASNYPINNTSNGPDTDTDYDIYPRSKRMDLFTGVLPSPLAANVSVTLPLSGAAPVTGIGSQSQTMQTGPVNVYETGGSGTESYAKYQNTNAANQVTVEEDPDNAGYPHIEADLSQATGGSINDLRDAVALQQIYERQARGGYRYSELILSAYGVRLPDAQWKPEFIGYAESQIYQNEVPNTSADGTNVQGELAAYSKVFTNGQFQYACKEHGWLFIYASVIAPLTYDQGIEKKWTRSTAQDHWDPMHAGLGEMAILSKELFFNDEAADDNVFGYNERGVHYKFLKSMNTGALRHNYTGTLNYWHLGQEFASRPTYSKTFIQEAPPVSRVISVAAGEPQLIVDASFECLITRAMPKYNRPGLERI